MPELVLIALADARGWLLMQERDSFAPVDPDLWGMPGGGLEPGEEPLVGALRELAEETGVRLADLDALGRHEIPCEAHGVDVVHAFAARTDLTDAQIRCGEGRQMVFVDPVRIAELPLTRPSRVLLPAVLAHLGEGVSKRGATAG